MATKEFELTVTAGSVITVAEIETICKIRSELSEPPQAFLISVDSMRNSLLAVRTEFLGNGEGLSWPGLPFLGATFDLSWGYAFVDVSKCEDGDAEFKQPSCRFEDSAVGDTWGYRFCPIDANQIPKMIHELGHIRIELSKPKARSAAQLSMPVTITDL